MSLSADAAPADSHVKHTRHHLMFVSWSINAATPSRPPHKHVRDVEISRYRGSQQIFHGGDAVRREGVDVQVRHARS